MDNINKKTIYGVLIGVAVLFVVYVIYSYTQQRIEKKLSKEKKKLKKYYEQQFNQMFYQNQSGENNVNYIDPMDQDYSPDQDSQQNGDTAGDDPSGIESDASSSHSDTLENGKLRDIKILGDGYRKSDTGKKCRG